MARGRRARAIVVSDKQREVLEQLVRERSTHQSLAKRTCPVLESLRGLANTAISELLPLDRPQVVLWRGRWIEQYPELCRIEHEHPEELEAAHPTDVS
ncbi:hypothetical protein [Paenibacillus sp. 8b26]|uniref:hypothetical protein n=1 Tax=Paenibacillus sp. 8b26 TaxID=3424133 RepID=UPI003D65C415